ncbi:MAG: NTP transferase domain-containing protein [Ignavibacteria bacterium]|nr:NTP transferase domain-containing protein [Ignavibacteria bacterium]
MNYTYHIADIACVILAAGKGKRMNNPDVPKVMAEVAGKPLIGHVLSQVVPLNPKRIIVVVGHHKNIVIDYLDKEYPWVDTAEQTELLGTGHAVMQTEPFLDDFYGDVLIITGDTPLLRIETLAQFIEEHQRFRGFLSGSVLSATTDNPTGYGRIYRNSKGEFLKIIEEKDADEEVKKITEVNTGIFIINGISLYSVLKEVENSNAQGEYYLTDIVELFLRKGMNFNAVKAKNFDEFLGINTVEQLAKAEEVYLSNQSIVANK